MVKNTQHPKRTISSPQKGDEHSHHFQRGFPPRFPNLGGQASQQGGVRGRELELDILILAIANFKNLLRITMWAEEFFHGGVDLNPLSTVRSPQSAVRSPQSNVVQFDACYIM